MAQQRAEIRRRLQELNQLVIASETQENAEDSTAASHSSLSYLSTPSTSLPTFPRQNKGESVAELRRRIDLLEQENARLALISEPPAYGEEFI